MLDERLATVLGRNVRTARLRLGLTQDGLAEVSGLHRNYVGGVERGERNPTLTVLERLAAALGVAPASLIETGRRALRAAGPRGR